MHEYTITNGWNQLFTTGMAIDGEEAWFANNTFNGLFKMNLRTLKAEFVTIIPNEGVREPVLYSNCYVWEEYVVLIPINANYLTAYNKKSQQIFQYKIIDNEGEIVRGFWSSWQENKYIYFVSIRKPVIARFDVDNQDITVFCDWDKEIRNKGYKYLSLFWGEVLADRKLLYIPCLRMSCICEVDLEQKHAKVIEMDRDIEGIITICKCNGKYYISSFSGNVFEIEFGLNRVKSEEIGTIAGGSCRSIVIGNDIYFFPRKAKNIYRYSTIQREMKSCLTEDLHIEEAWSPVARSYNYYNDSYYQMAEKVNENTWIFMLSDGCLYWLSDGKIEKKEAIVCKLDEFPLCELDNKDLNGYKEYCDKDKILRNSLPAFLQILDNQGTKSGTRTQRNNGRQIYECTISGGV